MTRGEKKKHAGGRPREMEDRHDFTVSISGETADEFVRLADLEKLSMSALVRTLIVGYVREHKAGLPPRAAGEARAGGPGGRLRATEMPPG